MPKPEFVATHLDIELPVDGVRMVPFDLPATATVLLTVGPGAEEGVLAFRVTASRPFEATRGQLDALADLLDGASSMIRDAAKRQLR